MILIQDQVKALTIRREGTNVLLFDGKTGALIARMPWDVAERLAVGLMAKAAEAETAFWYDADKYFDGGIKVKRVLGTPVVTSVEQLNRLG
jgi:hypothetical protein